MNQQVQTQTATEQHEAARGVATTGASAHGERASVDSGDVPRTVTPYIIRRVAKTGRVTFHSIARGKNDSRVYLGSYATAEEALAVFNAHIETGIIPQPQRRGPKPGQTTRKRPRRQYPPRERRLDPVAQFIMPHRRIDRVPMMRAIWARLTF